MPLSEAHARIAIVVWSLTWLPGLALASWRAERRLRARHRWRALIEYAALLAIPLVSFGVYAFSDAQRYADARGGSVGWSSFLSVAQVAVPYAVSAAYLLLARRSNTGPSATARWWVGLLLGLLAVPVLVPGLLMAQLMVFVGG
jgi:hypothetical protein